jgi:hypothetical protein
MTLRMLRPTLNETIPMRSNEILAFSSYRIPVPFEHLYDDIFVSSRGTFAERLIEGEWDSLNYCEEGKKYTPLQHLANAILKMG